MKTRIALAVICLTGKSMLFAQSTQEVILFDYDSYALNENASDQLDQFIQNLDVENIKKVEIIGHTDSDGSLVYNQELSRNRAETVQQKFNALALDQKKLKINFQGEEKPVASNTDDTGKQSNRRVEILVEYFDFQIPESFKVKPLLYRVHPSYDTVLQIGRADSYVTIQKNSFVDGNGQLIKDTVDILFTEYRNAAEIMFSGIPMTFTEKGEEKVMSSGGMFEIRGEFNGKPLEIEKNKSLKIDYEMTQSDPEMKFYQLNSNQEWKIKQTPLPPSKSNFFPAPSLQRAYNIGYTTIVKEVTITSEKRLNRAYNLESKLLYKLDKKIAKQRLKYNDELTQMKVNKIEKKHVKKIERLQDQARIPVCYSSFELLSNAYFEENTPEIMKNLKIEKFGKYNCDIAYRLPNKTTIAATFLDENKDELDDLAYLAMVDPHYNGAISFYNPNQFNCNKSAKNVLALFTKDGRLFVCDGDSFRKLNIRSSGKYTIPMKDVSNKIKSSEDLAQYLGIKL